MGSRLCGGWNREQSTLANRFDDLCYRCFGGVTLSFLERYLADLNLIAQLVTFASPSMIGTLAVVEDTAANGITIGHVFFFGLGLCLSLHNVLRRPRSQTPELSYISEFQRTVTKKNTRGKGDTKRNKCGYECRANLSVAFSCLDICNRLRRKMRFMPTSEGSFMKCNNNWRRSSCSCPST